ncbi:AAA family ATPase [Candidatus Woesearchaeota archaeon]|nr:AAA family ATPase [Candidatus Woesearchaeota archaeon]
MEWFEELGFDSNPFDASLEASAKYAVGLEGPLEELEYYVDSGSAGFVEGPLGSGKSVLLRKLADKLGGRAVYFDCSHGELDVRSIIRKKTSLLDRLFGKNPRGIVLLIDNAAGLSPVAMGMLKYHYDNNHIGTVVFAGSSLKSAGLSPALADRIGSRVFRLSALNESDAVLMVKHRLGSSAILGDGAIRKLYKMSGKDPRKFLQLCEDACKAAVDSKSDAVGNEHILSLKMKNSVGDLNG